MSQILLFSMEFQVDFLTQRILMNSALTTHLSQPHLILLLTQIQKTIINGRSDLKSFPAWVERYINLYISLKTPIEIDDANERLNYVIHKAGFLSTIQSKYNQILLKFEIRQLLLIKRRLRKRSRRNLVDRVLAYQTYSQGSSPSPDIKTKYKKYFFGDFLSEYVMIK